ncbi:MAG: hypothetical protein LBP37_04865, partial [Spirochaetaceae bacterium]|nr:hypothetical protein [Spirochaetaceae bacterium]
MKKSFLYAVPAALIMALLFAGCPQDSDDEDSGGTIPSYQKDVDGIAVAFADGAPVVYLKDNLHLENNELVIPAGKTLDLSRSVTIDEIGPYGKIVAVGNITFTENDKYDILLYKSPSAKIIATDSFIEANVDSRYVVNEADGTVILGNDEAGVQYTENPGKHVKAFAEQVIHIANFDIGSDEAWKTYLTGQRGKNNELYVPVEFNSTINKEIAQVVGKWGSGRRVYIIGDVTITGHIDLTGDKLDPEANVYGGPVQFNVADDENGSLLIAGAVVFEGDEGQVSTKGGLTVLGTLTTRGNRLNAKVNAKGKLVTYLLRLESGGGGFGGNVQLIGILPSRFGGQAVFAGSLSARGPVIIDSVTFQSYANFKNNVEFLGPKGSVKAEDPNTVEIEGTVTLNFKGDPVDLTENIFKLGANSAVTYNQDYEIKNGTFSIEHPVTFNGKATFGSAATFNNNVSFNSDLVLSPDYKYDFGTKSVYFAKPVELSPLEQLARESPYVSAGSAAIPGTFGAEVTFNSSATFKGGSVTFTKKAVFSGDLTFDKAGATFNEDATFGKRVSFAAGSAVTTAGTLKHIPSGLYITKSAADPGSVTPDAVGGLLLTAEGQLNVSGTLSLGKALINIGDGKIRIPTAENTGIVFGAGTIGNPIVVADAYTVEAGTTSGISTGLFGTVLASNSKPQGYIFVDKTGFSSEELNGSQATLKFVGSIGSAWSNIKVSKDITIKDVTVEIGGDNKVVGSISITGTGNPVITLTGG